MRTKAMNDLCAVDATKLYYSNNTRFIPCGSATPVGDFSVNILETQPYSITFKDAQGHFLLRSEDPFREAHNSSVSMLHTAGDML